MLGNVKYINIWRAEAKMKYLMTQSSHHGLLVEGPTIPCYQCLILQIAFSLLTGTLSDNDGLQRNFWLHHNDCLMDTSLINCFILTCSVSFVKADSRNNWYWHCWTSYLITIALSSIFPRFPTFIFMCVYIDTYLLFKNHWKLLSEYYLTSVLCDTGNKFCLQSTSLLRLSW